MLKEHSYNLSLTWTGNKGTGTVDYRSYERSHKISIAGKADLDLSSDPAFRGDGKKYNPEELLLSALSSCHMLWYLHLCSDHGITVAGYTDEATGLMIENSDGSGQFKEVRLSPDVLISSGDPKLALSLHSQAHKMCFIARSCNFPVLLFPSVNMAT